MNITWEQAQERYREASAPKKGMKEILDAYIASQNQEQKPELTESQEETVSEK